MLHSFSGWWDGECFINGFFLIIGQCTSFWSGEVPVVAQCQQVTRSSVLLLEHDFFGGLEWPHSLKIGNSVDQLPTCLEFSSVTCMKNPWKWTAGANKNHPSLKVGTSSEPSLYFGGSKCELSVVYSKYRMGCLSSKMGRKLPHDLQEKPLGNNCFNMLKKDHGNMRFEHPGWKQRIRWSWKTLDVFGFWKIIFKYPRGDFQVPWSMLGPSEGFLDFLRTIHPW